VLVAVLILVEILLPRRTDIVKGVIYNLATEYTMEIQARIGYLWLGTSFRTIRVYAWPMLKSKLAGYLG